MDISQYKQACKDMDDANKEGTYFRDIKNENFVVKNKSSDGRPPMVKFIDIDMVVTKKYQRHYANRCGTPGFVTNQLLEGKRQGNTTALKSSDQYAMLLSMMEATDKDCAVFIGGPHNNGIINEQNKDSINKWIDKHVTQDCKEEITNFLKNPSQFPLTGKLSDKLKW